MLRETIPATRLDGASTDERSLGELFADLSRETRELISSEVTLAKTELTHKAVEVGKDVGFLLAGGAVLYAGFLALVATLIIVLGQAGLPWWGSALIVAVAVTAAGGFLVWLGIDSLKKADLAPRETIQALKEDPR